MPLIANAMRLDPHHPAWYWVELGVCHFMAKQYAEAIAALRHHPNPPFYCWAYLAGCHAQLGEVAAMRLAAYEVIRLQPDFRVSVFVAAEPFKLADDHEHFAGSLRRAGLPE
jgi:adenylate cyclase